MATCKKCGEETGFLKAFCDRCNMEYGRETNHLVTTYLVTTSFNFEGYTIKEYCGIVSGETVLGTGLMSEFSASSADFFGIGSISFSQKMEVAKNASLEKLIMASVAKGGNALIGIDFDYISFSNNIIGVSATGTSVLVEKNTTPQLQVDFHKTQ